MAPNSATFHRPNYYQEDYKPLPLAPQTQLFGAGLDDGLLTRAEALAAVDISKHGHGQPPGAIPQLKHDMMYHPGMATTPHTPPISRTNQVGSGEEAGAGGGGGGWSHKAGLWKTNTDTTQGHIKSWPDTRRPCITHTRRKARGTTSEEEEEEEEEATVEVAGGSRVAATSL
ncbi:hypothetical protein O3P69_017081 [Scylla paramamosain]|uniref:Uncharacterized protein n=1 Tax=Scylla paramamosain TaxID=85552 RepID=A0AAW0TWX5_SCYPA